MFLMDSHKRNTRLVGQNTSLHFLIDNSYKLGEWHLPHMTCCSLVEAFASSSNVLLPFTMLASQKASHGAPTDR